MSAKLGEDFQTVIGLEVHAQLNTTTKMFCGCRCSFGEEPNSNVCPVCLGLPGALPVLNRGAIAKTIRLGLMLDCRIPKLSHWDRKSYFYPDMPKNYQISQFDEPLCQGGYVPLLSLAYPKDAQKDIANPGKKVRLNRIHLEEDVAKSTHLEETSAIDFNRAGTPLMEIVSEPDLESAEEAVAFLNSLRRIINFAGIGDADMEKGQLRCDVNISVRPQGSSEFGKKIELKNLNSVSAARRAIKVESRRQIDAIINGEVLRQSTRRWNEQLGVTELMRLKEDSQDYRYFPDPDLPEIDAEEIEKKECQRLPERPDSRQKRLQREFGLNELSAGTLCSSRDLADYFEEAANSSKNPNKCANFLLNNLLALLNEAKLDITSCPLPAEQLSALTNVIEDGSISGSEAKSDVLPLMFTENLSAREAIAKLGIGGEKTSGKEIKSILDKLIEDNPKAAEELRNGNKKASGFFIGRTIKELKNKGAKANPRDISEELARIFS